MEDDEKAQDYIARIRIELSKVVSIMMEAEHDGFVVSFSIGHAPDHAVDVSLTKTYR